MRVLNAAQSTLAYLGVLAGHEHTCDDVADPLLAAFVRRMLVEESLPTLRAGAGRRRRSPMSSRASPACATPRSATATTRSPPTARRRSSQRLLNPTAERLRPRPGRSSCLAVAVAAWMVYLIRASRPVRAAVAGRRSVCRPGRRDRRPDRRRCGGAGRRHPGHRHDLRPRARRRAPDFRAPLAAALGGLLSARPDRPWSGGSRRTTTGRRRHEARTADRAVSGHAARRGRRLGERGRLRGAGDRLLAADPRARPAATPAPATSTSPASRRREAREIVAALAEKRHRRSRRSATIPTRCIPTRRTARPSSTT